MVKFVDQAFIVASSGKGGPGCGSMRREKFIEFGGPDGGDGGKGGDVVVVGDSNITTLQDLRLHPHQRAHAGQAGMGKQRHGKKGDDKLIRLPLGSILTNGDTGEFLFEVLDDTPRVLLKGGRGGLGNTHFKTSTNQAPRYHQPGEEGQEMRVEIELKIMADVGLVGFPNAGKSTLISAVSAARPKVADYPFTTLTPKLGVVQLSGYRSFVIADIPGLIEGAHEGLGLGDQFLRHIQRTSCLAFLLDSGPLAEHPPAEAYEILIHELESFSPDLMDKPRVILLTKQDIAEEAPHLDELTTELGQTPLPVSAATGQGMPEMLEVLWKLVEAHRAAQAAEKNKT